MMKLVVQVIEAKNLVGLDSNSFSDLFVRLKLGKQKFRTKAIKKNMEPKWNEQFNLWVDDLKEKLVISVKGEDKFIHNHLIGRVKFPISLVFDEEIKSLGNAWYSLKPKNKKKHKNKECGEIHLSIFLSQNNASSEQNVSSDQLSSLRKYSDASTCSPSQSSNGRSNSSSPVREEITSSKDEKNSSQKSFAGRIAQMFSSKSSDVSSISPSISMELDQSETDKVEVEVDDIKTEDPSSNETFEETVRKMQSADQGSEIPSNLPGGVVMDQLYIISTEDLNVLLFSPNSNFAKSLADIQGTTELQMSPWKLENDNTSLKRSVSYVKAATKLIKSVKGYEEQTYLKADEKNFAVLASVSTPDVMYGSTFKAEVLYVITPGPELPSGEQCSRLVISWRMNFLQSTMMKGMIENGARQGMKESFDQYATLLSQTVKPVDSKDLGSTKEQALASLKADPQSDLKLAMQYFANFTFISTFLMGLYVMIHMCLAAPNTIQGLEFFGLDLPDSVGEVVKLFGLPPEEFLINDFTCHLKRKMPLQGRLFVSARILGFHAKLFGHKTKFFLLWEDIEDIQVVPPTFSSMGSPIIVITIRQGRGVDAKHGAKTQDEQGRLKYYFQSFVSFNVANRTIMALWKARSLSIEQKVQLVEDDPDNDSVTSEESGSFLGSDDISMSEVHSCALPVPVSFFMELFSGGELDCRVMEKSGCVSYSYTPWVSENNDVYERAVYYKFEKRISRYKVEVTSTQQKTLLDGKGWLVEEVMNFHGVPLGDYFNLHLRYQIDDLLPKGKGCKVQVLFGIEWLKNTKHQKRITKNILKNLQERLKLTFSLVEKEFLEK
ncbi:C2 and GRAM domain-containing protein [Trifolium repens]|nr:C2 and GRAM domain-containing protein [Trifolium repens]